MIKRPTFGGKPTTATKPPNKKVVDALGGSRPKTKGFDMNVKGNREFGFIQATPKQATAAMMGRAPPKTKTHKSSTRSDSKKQFGKVPGKSPF
jgi:hypothetical protein